MPPLTDRPIRFVHRGSIVAVHDAPTTKSALYWLREDAGLVGTKEGCNEGDCGACMVIVAERDDAAPGGVALRPVNACLQLLASLDGRALLTVEDLRAADGTPHPTQQALVACHGSQCGFCTPGFTMSLAAFHDGYAIRGERPTRQAVADALSGNLCRCTGYRPIVDAGCAMFDAPGAAIDRVALRAALDRLADDPPLLYRARQVPHGGPAWVAAPRTVDALAALYLEHPGATLVAGATDVGIWITQLHRDLPELIRVDAIEALRSIAISAEAVTIGAGASLEAAWDALVTMMPSLGEMQLRFASLPLRLVGTMGGNVANGSPIGDSAPVLLALDATLHLRRGDVRRRLALDAFYAGYLQNRLAPGEFIEAIEVPRPHPATIVRAYKISKRYDCDISALSAAFAVRLDGGRVAEARFAFGGMAAICRRASAAEAAVVGAAWNEATVAAAAVAVSTEFAPIDDLRATRGYRSRVAANLLRRLWLETQGGIADASLSVWPRRVTGGRSGAART